jgi:ABC-type phosphate transport system auxiliary subunit
MAYDLEKYRNKREKVLGVKKKGISFGTWAATVSAIIVVGLISMVAPRSITYFTTRNLDDVIYKLSGEQVWPQDVIHTIATLDGVKLAIADKQGARLVVTFDRSITGVENMTAFFEAQGYQAVLLNKVNHRQRIRTEQEEAKLETL